MVTAQWKRSDEPIEHKRGVDGIAVIKGDTGPTIYVVTDGDDTALISQLVKALEVHLATRGYDEAWREFKEEVVRHDNDVD